MVKPNSEGSSVGVKIVREPGERPIDRNDWPYGPEVLVERYIPGRELTVGVLGDRPLAVTEIRHGTASSTTTPSTPRTRPQHLIPAPLAPELYQRALDHALRGAPPARLPRRDAAPTSASTRTIPTGSTCSRSTPSPA